MSTLLQQWGIDRMSIGERIALAQEILDSVSAEQPRLPLSDAKKAELARRLTDCEANPADEVPWKDVEAAAFARHRAS